MGKSAEDRAILKRISFIIQPVVEDGAGDELPANRVVVQSDHKVKGVSQLGGCPDFALGSACMIHGLPRTKVEVVVPGERADDILRAVVETIYTTGSVGRPAHSLASFEVLLEEHMTKVVRWMEGGGEGRLYMRVIRLLEKSLLRTVLRRTEGNQVQAARILGINRNTLRAKLKEMRLKPGRIQAVGRRHATPDREPPVRTTLA